MKKTIAISASLMFWAFVFITWDPTETTRSHGILIVLLALFVFTVAVASTARYEELERLRDAIRKHRDQSGDDRCFLDDYDLYAVLPEGFDKRALRLHEPETMRLNCERYIASRHDPSLPYISPQQEIEALKRRVNDLEAEVARRDGR